MKNFSDFGINVSGKTLGVEVKTTCPQCSHTRKKTNYPCLNVNTDKGVWHCHHCGWSGGLSSGVINRSAPPSRRVYPKPEFRPAALSDAAISFFTKRGITTEVLIRNRISMERVWMPQIEDEVTSIAFPYYKNGEVVNIKYRDNAKNFRQVAGAQKALYKFDDIREVTIITEGEMDALACEVAGFQNAVSVPDGAPSPDAKHFENKFDFLDEDSLDKVKTFVLAVDNDEPGHRLEDELSRRLGRDKCLRVTWPEGCKDANDVLLTHGAQILKECIEDAKPYPVEGVFSVADIEEDINNMLEYGLVQGEPTGWESVSRLYTPAPGQWTLVTGIPSMGKSEWLDALAVNLAESAGWTFGVCSPENQPISWHAAKLMEKRMGQRLVAGKVNAQAFSDAKAWLSQHFHFIMPEEPTLDSVLAKAKTLVRRHGMKGLIIDPYNELDHTKRRDNVAETEYVSLFLTQLRKFARENSIHVWLVAHPAKLMKDNKGVYPVPDGYSVSGSAHFFNKADNIIAVHRDTTNPAAPTEVHVQKIRSRWLGRRGIAYLQWRSESGRFREFTGAYSLPLRAEMSKEKVRGSNRTLLPGHVLGSRGGRHAERREHGVGAQACVRHGQLCCWRLAGGTRGLLRGVGGRPLLRVPVVRQGRLRGPDVGNVQVRTTQYQGDDVRLVLHPQDKDDEMFYTARRLTNSNKFELFKPVLARDGKRPEFWQTFTGRPCYFVPVVPE